MKKELTIFDKPENIKKLLLIFFIVLAALLIADFFVHKHADFPWEARTNFFAVYGFVSYVGLIYISKFLRLFLKRKEDYYKNKQ
ncbi:MAG: hypothetical protein B6I22_03905 [Desulfobacteraceae bacterium 4572_123]|nr:MAG: hypothetical protein B6I22_03905 [Desulfobacteraceae bacterium 4572_123]